MTLTAVFRSTPLSLISGFSPFPLRDQCASDERSTGDGQWYGDAVGSGTRGSGAWGVRAWGMGSPWYGSGCHCTTVSPLYCHCNTVSPLYCHCVTGPASVLPLYHCTVPNTVPLHCTEHCTTALYRTLYHCTEHCTTALYRTLYCTVLDHCAGHCTRLHPRRHPPWLPWQDLPGGGLHGQRNQCSSVCHYVPQNKRRIIQQPPSGPK